jgi:hypothetical protein
MAATLSPSEGYIIRKNRLAKGQLRFLRIPGDASFSLKSGPPADIISR